VGQSVFFFFLSFFGIVTSHRQCQERKVKEKEMLCGETGMAAEYANADRLAATSMPVHRYFSFPLLHVAGQPLSVASYGGNVK